MLRIEILLDKNMCKNMKAGTLENLRREIEKRIAPTHPEIMLRLDKSSASSVSVSGTRSDAEKKWVNDTLESIWQDDSWLPA